jgi:hypothetical protein
MEQRDYLMRQIEMMTQFLLILIRRLTGMKKNGHEEEQKAATDALLKEHLSTSLDEILQIPLNDIADFITKKKGIHQSNIDLFATVLVLNAKAETDENRKRQLLLLALELLQWADHSGGVFSLERHRQINEINALLE